jgi:hypothetical protein
MRQEALPQQMSTPGGEKRHAYVYQGHTTKLFRMLNLPSPYYTSVLTALQKMGCIRQLSRGGGSAESRWELIDDPTLELFNSMSDEVTGRASRLSVVEQGVETLGERIQALEDRFESTG